MSLTPLEKMVLFDALLLVKEIVVNGPDNINTKLEVFKSMFTEENWTKEKSIENMEDILSTIKLKLT